MHITLLYLIKSQQSEKTCLYVLAELYMKPFNYLTV